MVIEPDRMWLYMDTMPWKHCIGKKWNHPITLGISGVPGQGTGS